MTTFLPTKPKYMKKTIVETPWTQPVLSANGTLGGDSFAVSVSSSQGDYHGWCIFDSNVEFNLHTWLATNGIQNQWVIFYNPIPIKITNLNIVNATGQNRHIASGNVYFSDDGVTWTLHKAFTNSNYTQGSNWNIPITETGFHKYWKLGELYYASGSGGVGIAEMYITATTQTISAIESTKDDYDYIEHKRFAPTKPKYMKKTGSTVEELFSGADKYPLLSANPTFTYNTSTNGYWNYFENGNFRLVTGVYGAQAVGVCYFAINNYETQITKIEFQNFGASSVNNSINSVSLAYSDDGVTWTEFQSITGLRNNIPISGSTWFSVDITEYAQRKYFRMSITEGSVYPWSCNGLYRLTYKKSTISAIESTVEDYDCIEHRNFAVKRGA